MSYQIIILFLSWNLKNKGLKMLDYHTGLDKLGSKIEFDNAEKISIISNDKLNKNWESLINMSIV